LIHDSVPCNQLKKILAGRRMMCCSFTLWLDQLLLQWRLIGSTFPCSHQCVKWCTFDVGWHANCWHASCYLSASCATPEYGSHCWCPDCACTLGDRGTLRWHLKFSCKAAGHAVQLIVCNIPAMIATFLHCNKRLWFAEC